MEVDDRNLTTDIINNNKGCDGSSGDIDALQGDIGPSAGRGLKGDSGDKGHVGSRCPTG